MIYIINMKYFNQPFQIRLKEDWEDKIKTLLINYPILFKTKTQIMRAALIAIWREHENGELRRREQEAKAL